MRTGFYDLLDALWNSDFTPATTYRKANTPAVNVLESDDEYTVQVAAAGLTKEDITVKLDEEENLVISMQSKQEKKEEQTDAPTSESTEVAKPEAKPARYLRREFLNQSFVQRMTLPEDADLEGISAKVENGVLEVVIKKIKESEKPTLQRNIEIQ